MPKNFENEHESNNDRESIIFRAANGFMKIGRFVFNVDVVKQVFKAEDLEKQAEEYPEHEVGRKGKNLLAAGKIYIGLQRYDTGQKTLESALSPLRDYTSSGKLDSYTCLLEALRDLRAVYMKRALFDKALQADDEALIISAEMEMLFGPVVDLPTYADLNPEYGMLS